MQKLNRILNLRYTVLLAASVMLISGVLSQVAHAAGDASFVLTPSSGSYTVGSTFTVTVYETSQVSDNVAGVQANLTYNATDLRCNSVSVTGTPFTFLGQDTCSGGTVNIGEAAGSAVSGQQLVGTINFTVLTAGSASVAITTGSDIKDSSASSIWNGTNTTAAFTLANPAPSGGGATGGGGGASGSSGGGATKAPVASGSTNRDSGSNSGSAHPQTSTTPAQSQTSTTPTSTSQTSNAATTLAVTITDASGKPIANAKVVVANRYSEYTDAQGKAGFSNLASGTYAVTVSAPGQKTSQTEVTLTSNEAKQVSLKLASASSRTSMTILIAAGAVVLLVAIGSLGYLIRRIMGLGHSRSKSAVTPGIVLGGTESAPVVPTSAPISAPTPPPLPQNNNAEISPIAETAPAPLPVQNTLSVPTPAPSVVTPQIAPAEPVAAPPENKPPLG
jgi:hypothetical protein